MNNKWFDIERAVLHSHLSYAKMITEGRIVAANQEMVIIEYPSSPICNRMMKPQIKQIVVQLATEFYSKATQLPPLTKALK